MRFTKLAVLAALALPQVAWAGPTQHDFKFISGSGVGFHGVQVGTYKGQLDGGAYINIWCTDFYNYAGNAKVHKSSIGEGDLSKTRWGTLGGQPNLYKQAAYLTTLFKSDNHSEWGYIHSAIWQLMSGGSPWLTGAQQTKVNDYKTLASNQYWKYNYDKMYVLTDLTVTNGTGRRGDPYKYGCQGIQYRTTCGIQEQLTGEITLTATPEPASMGLLALGLVGMAAVGHRRRKQR